MTDRSAPVVTAEQMRAKLAELQRSRETQTTPPPLAPEPIGPFRQRLRERVALLDYFELADLSPARARASSPPDPAPSSFLRRLTDRVLGSLQGESPDSSTPTDPTHHLEPDAIEFGEFGQRDCDVVTTAAGAKWSLRLPIRRETLAALGPERALATTILPDAIRAADDDVAHRMAVRILSGQRGLRGLSATELSGILRAVEWLEGLVPDLPSVPAIHEALDLANVLAPLRSVDTPNFVGRDVELGMLHEHVHGKAGTRPLAIHGPGGVGKSTLLAHFVLDHVDRSEDALLFAYLSFDRGELDVQYPLTLVSEACRQVALQRPALRDALADVRVQINEVLTVQLALAAETTTSRGRSTRDVNRSRSDEAGVAAYFAEVVNGASGGEPVLLVLDTFEMAQRKRGSFLKALDGALTRMQQRMPSLRIVIAGRAEVTHLKVVNRPLTGLDERQAAALLDRSLGDSSVSREVRQLVVSNVSGNPLSLRLAADLLRAEGTSLLGRRGQRRLLKDLEAEQVQGILYRRILDHVDHRVRPLANPGLVVRKITTDVIASVLAEPCGLRHRDPESVRRLFDLLKSEVSLVTETRTGVLVHRADVRREMLPLLQARDPEGVTDIHERAVAFYAGRPEIDDQIEHLYHRLMLGQDTGTLDAHWVGAATRFLEDAWDELPPSSRVYLAGKLHIEADPADLQAADQTAWVRQSTSQARALLDAGEPAKAHAILTQRSTSPEDFTITRLTVESLAAQGKEREAFAMAEAAIGRADARGEGLDAVHLSILAARVAEDGPSGGARGPGAVGRDWDVLASGLATARFHYLEGRDSGQDLGARTEALTAGVGALRVSRRFRALREGLTRPEQASLPPWPRSEEDGPLRADLLTEAGELTERELAAQPGLLRELAAELGSELPNLLIAATNVLGVEPTGSSASQLPDAGKQRLEDIVTSSSPYPQIAETGWTSEGDEDADEGAVPALPITSQTAGSAIADALRTSPGDDELKDSVSDYWQLEADRPSYDYDEGPPTGDSK